MSTRLLSILLPAALAVVALIAFVAVDFVQARGASEGTKPNFSEYVAGYAKQERALEDGSAETVAALGDVPSEPVAAAEEDVVSRDAVPPSSWFRRDRSQNHVKVEFTCVKGVGGSKVCTAETMKR